MGHDQHGEFATPILMPRIGCGSHQEIAVDDFIALVVIELVILLVGPTPGLFFEHWCHEAKLANVTRKTN